MEANRDQAAEALRLARARTDAAGAVRLAEKSHALFPTLESETLAQTLRAFAGILEPAADHYEALGVSRDADVKAMHAAYKARALLCHPDKCSHPVARAAFERVVEAHTVLKDPAKRTVEVDAFCS